MRILIVTRLFPLPENKARGTFVSDNVELLTELGHEVKVLNILPRMLKMQEARRSTMEGVAKAPKQYYHGKFDVSVKRHFEFPELPSFTAFSASRIGIDWKPDLVIAHTLWPCGFTAQKIAKKHSVPWIAVVHGYDFHVALQDHRSKRIEKLAKSADKLVVVSDVISKFDSITIPCYVNVDKEWHREMKKPNKLFRKSKIDILFPSDPRRPEKNHILALRVGEELETRGWKVGITTLKKQPRTMVWDRMLAADVCLITSTRESGPLVAREAIVCGCPVVSVDVGDMSEWMNVCKPEVNELADAIENRLQYKQEITLPQRFEFESVSNQWKTMLESM